MLRGVTTPISEIGLEINRVREPVGFRLNGLLRARGLAYVRAIVVLARTVLTPVLAVFISESRILWLVWVPFLASNGLSTP
jgi:hypothetical protein